ncbi:MAG: hypothetical protein GY756_05915 [bacterium]|nr:hypothetical protein [bacterium]
MKEFVSTFTILPGKTDAWLDFAHECSTRWKNGLNKLHKKIGIIKENWYLQRSSNGDKVVIYTIAVDETFMEKFQTVDSEFIRWFRKKVKETSGSDLSGTVNIPELILKWEAE